MALQVLPLDLEVIKPACSYYGPFRIFEGGSFIWKTLYLASHSDWRCLRCLSFCRWWKTGKHSCQSSVINMRSYPPQYPCSSNPLNPSPSLFLFFPFAPPSTFPFFFLFFSFLLVFLLSFFFYFFLSSLTLPSFLVFFPFFLSLFVLKLFLLFFPFVWHLNDWSHPQGKTWPSYLTYQGRDSCLVSKPSSSPGRLSISCRFALGIVALLCSEFVTATLSFNLNKFNKHKSMPLVGHLINAHHLYVFLNSREGLRCCGSTNQNQN